MITWALATAADLDAYYGERQRPTMRALVIKVDEVPLGVIALVRPIRDQAYMISEFKPELEPYLKSMTILRAIKAAMKWAEGSPFPVMALCQDSEKLLNRLGFELSDDKENVWRFSPH